jgi:hypothetical protein
MEASVELRELRNRRAALGRLTKRTSAPPRATFAERDVAIA